jgi:hypothetical protein
MQQPGGKWRAAQQMDRFFEQNDGAGAGTVV